MVVNVGEGESFLWSILTLKDWAVFGVSILALGVSSGFETSLKSFCD